MKKHSLSAHPVNLGLRFALEMAALLALGLWGWQHSEDWTRFLLAFGIPLVAAIAWATFRVPNDPGPAPVAVPGIVRLILELALFASATWALYDAQGAAWSAVFCVAVIAHYIASYDRVLQLMRK